MKRYHLHSTKCCNPCKCHCFYYLPPCPPAPPISPQPIIFSVSAGDGAVSGEGNPGCTVVVTLPGGTLLAAVVEADGLWLAAVPTGVTLTAGESVSAMQYCPAALPSAPVSTVVQAIPVWTVTGLVSPVVIDDQGRGDAFLDLFNITVELRTSLHIPSSLRTIVQRGDTDVGRFAITDVPQGAYILYIDRPGYLPRTLAVSVTAASPDVIEVSPPDNSVFRLIIGAGDSNGDGVINQTDVDLVRAAMYAQYPNSRYSADVDFNADGYVDGRDVSIQNGNFGRTSASYPGAVWD